MPTHKTEERQPLPGAEGRLSVLKKTALRNAPRDHPFV
jgi:hypothetical protein